VDSCGSVGVTASNGCLNDNILLPDVNTRRSVTEVQTISIVSTIQGGALLAHITYLVRVVYLNYFRPMKVSDVC
jgi:hypothetical protein